MNDDGEGRETASLLSPQKQFLSGLLETTFLEDLCKSLDQCRKKRRELALKGRKGVQSRKGLKGS